MGVILISSISLAVLPGVGSNSSNDPIDHTELIEDDIFTAIRSIDYTSINILLSGGLDVDTTDRQGNTPLMVAAEVGNPRILTILLAHHPAINKQNQNGVTALMIAAKTGQYPAVSKLVAHGADISIRDNDGSTAISLASKYGHNRIVSFLKYSQSHEMLAN